jgi:hypothetical protein
VAEPVTPIPAPLEGPPPATLDDILGRLAAIEEHLRPEAEVDPDDGDILDRVDPEPRTLVRYHLVMMIVWLVLIIPTVVWWKESILWVAFMSLYANFVGHFSGWDAARAEQSNDT